MNDREMIGVYAQAIMRRDALIRNLCDALMNSLAADDPKPSIVLKAEKELRHEFD